jgi:hypothetical protein
MVETSGQSQLNRGISYLLINLRLAGEWSNGGGNFRCGAIGPRDFRAGGVVGLKPSNSSKDLL